MTVKFAPVQKSIREMTAAELGAWLRGLPDSEVMRSILIAEIRDVKAGAERNPRTLRGMWYDTVKPILSRAGLLNKTTKGGRPVPWDDNLSKYLAELVRMGQTSYEELQIIDGSRQRQPARDVTYPLEDVQMVGGHYPWIILFTEKDTIWGQLESIATLYGVSAISGGGQPSYACTENTVRAIMRSEAYRKNRPESLLILSLTDYDPFGYHIADSQYNQVLEAAQAADASDRGALKKVRHIRLGLHPEQLTAAEREANAYEPKDIGLEKWYKDTGGVDGRPLGLELDALPLSRLRRMFAEGIEQHINLEARLNDLRTAFIDLLAWEIMAPQVQKLKAQMAAALEENNAIQQLGAVVLPSDLFLSAAVAGNDWITPVQTMRLFGSYQAQAEQIMRAAIE